MMMMIMMMMMRMMMMMMMMIDGLMIPIDEHILQVETAETSLNMGSFCMSRSISSIGIAGSLECREDTQIQAGFYYGQWPNYWVSCYV